MPFIDTVKRINVDEFKKEDQDVAKKIANIYNYFAEQVTNTVNGNLDFDNLNRKEITITVIVDADGLPLQQTQFVTDVGLDGTTVLRAINSTNPVAYPTSAPFVTYSASGDGIYTINHITGLVADNSYQLVIELIF